MSAGDPSVIPSALDWLEEGRRVALATVIQTWGSAPRPVGSQLADRRRREFPRLGFGRLRRGGGDRRGGRGASHGQAQDARIRRRGRHRLEGWARLRRHHPHLRRAVGRRSRRGTGVLHQLAGDIEARRKVALVTELATGATAACACAGRSRRRFGAGACRGLPPRPEHRRCREATAKSSSTCSLRPRASSSSAPCMWRKRWFPWPARLATRF